LDGEKVLIWCYGAIAGIFQFLFGGWTLLIQTLLAVATFDIITGFWVGAKNAKANSRDLGAGFPRKIGMFVVVALAHLIDKALGSATPVVQTVALCWYIGKEGVSVTENLGKLGVPLPPFIVVALEQLQKEGNKDG